MRPDDIPEDVWEAACLAMDGLPRLSLSNPDRHEIVIAQAILAERERCGEVARVEIIDALRTVPAGGFEDQREPRPKAVARLVVDAIRKGSP